jgi:hypothetical protein
MYATGTAGDFAYGRRFWADEYRMNAKLFNFPKPVATFLQGFTMGGGWVSAAMPRTGSSATHPASPCPNAVSAWSRMWAAP